MGTSILQHFVSLAPYVPDRGYTISPLIFPVMLVMFWGQTVNMKTNANWADLATDGNISLDGMRSKYSHKNLGREPRRAVAEM